MNNPGPITQTAAQIDNYTVKPEWFHVRHWTDPIAEPFHGQSRNDAEAAKRSREEFNRGSLRAAGNVDKSGPPHTKFGAGEE